MPLRFLVFLLVVSTFMFGVDHYVLRRWKKYASVRRRLRWTIAPLTLLLFAMPLVMPVYAATSRWWDGGAARGIVVGLWAFHYAPRTLIAAWLLVVDVLRGLGWIVRKALPRSEAASARSTTRSAPSEAASSPSTTAADPSDRASGRFARASGPSEVASGPFTTASGPSTTASGPSTGDSGGLGTASGASTKASDLVTIDRPARPGVSRRDALRTAGWALASVPFVAVGTGLFKTVYDFEVRRVRVPIAGLPRGLAGLRIAQVSDLHAGSFFTPAPVDEALRLLLAERADVITLTGDFVNHDAAELAPVLPLLQRLKADLGVFGILGNHDHYAHVPDVLAALATTPVRMLVNARQTVRVDGADLHLLGTDNTGFGQTHADLPRTLDGLGAPGEREEVRLLLTHDPSFWDEARAAGVHLTLAGHTHGGQIGWEWEQAGGAPLGVNLADLRYARTAGLYEEASALGPQRLYINRGLGTTGPPLRLGVRPEITVLELERA